MSAQRLSKAQQRHLIAMLSPLDDTLFWTPYGSGEFSTARTLKEKGLLEGSASSWSDAYYLSDEGLRIARELRDAADLGVAKSASQNASEGG